MPSGDFDIYKGWFSDTVPKLPSKLKFAMINVDGDLYQSTIDALDPLFGRKMISNGCMLLFDDYDCNAARLELGERKAWQDLIKKYSIQYSTKGSYGLVSHAVIVHDYRDG